MINNDKLDKQNVEDILGLTPIQLGILYETLQSDIGTLYLAQLTLRLYGDIDIKLLRQSFKLVTEDNQMLRCVFRWENIGNPVQIILKAHTIPVFEYDMENMSEEQAGIEIRRHREFMLNNGIDLKSNPIGLQVFRLSSRSYHLVITWHHIIYDGWSNIIFIKEILTTYGALRSGGEVHRQMKAAYKKYVEYHRKRDRKEQEELFWRQYFGGYKEDAKPLRPFNRPILKIGRVTAKIPEDVMNNISTYQKNGNTTLATIIFGAWLLLLYKNTGKTDLSTGITMSGRNADIPGIENTIGLFINTLPLRIEFKKAMKVKDLLSHIRNKVITLIQYETSNLTDIKKFGGIQGNLYDTLAVVENYPVDLQQWLEKNDELYLQSYESEEINNFNLVLCILPQDYNTVLLQYNTELYPKEYMERSIRNFIGILRIIVREPEMKADDVERLLLQETDDILTGMKERNSNIDAGTDMLW
jgi:fengycin family lipopeptide synthetase D